MVAQQRNSRSLPSHAESDQGLTVIGQKLLAAYAHRTKRPDSPMDARSFANWRDAAAISEKIRLIRRADSQFWLGPWRHINSDLKYEFLIRISRVKKRMGGWDNGRSHYPT